MNNNLYSNKRWILMILCVISFITILLMTGCGDSDNDGSLTDSNTKISVSASEQDEVSLTSEEEETGIFSTITGFFTSALKGVLIFIVITIILLILILVVFRRKAKRFSLSSFMRKKRIETEKRNRDIREARKEVVKMAADQVMTHNPISNAVDTINTLRDYSQDRIESNDKNEINFRNINANELDMFKRK